MALKTRPVAVLAVSLYPVLIFHFSNTKEPWNHHIFSLKDGVMTSSRIFSFVLSLTNVFLSDSNTSDLYYSSNITFFLAYPGERLMRLCHGSLSTFTQITTHQILVKLAQTDHLIDLQPHCAQGQGRVCCFMGSNLWIMLDCDLHELLCHWCYGFPVFPLCVFFCLS